MNSDCQMNDLDLGNEFKEHKIGYECHISIYYKKELRCYYIFDSCFSHLPMISEWKLHEGTCNIITIYSTS